MLTSRWVLCAGFSPVLCAACPTLDATNALNASKYHVKGFEFYLGQGLFRESQSEATNSKLEFVEIRPLNIKPSSDFKEFVAMRLSLFAQLPDIKNVHLTINNWESIHAQRRMRPDKLEEWTPVGPNPDMRTILDMAPFFPNDLKLSLQGIFTLLHQAQWADSWAKIYIGKFKNTPPGHPNEPFYCFWDKDRPQPFQQYIYVSAVSGQIMQDDSPFKIQSLAAILVSNSSAVSPRPFVAEIPTS